MHKSDYDHFVTSPMWHEIVETLKEVKVGLLEDIANLDPKEEATELARKQGRLAMANWMLLQPDAILIEIETEERKQKERGE